MHGACVTFALLLIYALPHVWLSAVGVVLMLGECQQHEFWPRFDMGQGVHEAWLAAKLVLRRSCHKSLGADAAMQYKYSRCADEMVPALPQEPAFTADGFELSAGVNHLSHFLLVNLLMEDLKKSPGGKPRCVIVGSGTAVGQHALIMPGDANAASTLDARQLMCTPRIRSF